MRLLVAAAAARGADIAANRTFLNRMDMSSGGTASVIGLHAEMGESATLVSRNGAARAAAQRDE